jgi:hypothetical protein
VESLEFKFWKSNRNLSELAFRANANESEVISSVCDFVLSCSYGQVTLNVSSQ